MIKRTLRTKFAVILVLATTAVGAGIYVLNIIFSEYIAFRQGGPAYTLLVTSDTVRDFPRFATAGQAVEFAYSARDGTAPSQITMTYASDETAEVLDRKHRDYCERKPYSAVPANKLLLESVLGCDASDYRIEIDFRQHNSAIIVTEVFLER